MGRLADLAETETALQRRNERLGEFAAVVSHDLRNPLAVAKGRVALARQGDAEANLDTIERSLDRMERIVDACCGSFARTGTSGRRGRSISGE